MMQPIFASSLRKLFCLVVMLFVCMPIVACADVEINEANFPDPNMRSYISSVFDGGYRASDGKWVGKNDGVLNYEELARATGLAYDNPVSDQGISHFFALEVLGCRNGILSTLDVSSNHALGLLNCDYNNLRELNLSNNHALYHLHCIGNQLEGLDVSNNPELNDLMCGNNPLGRLDVSRNLKLEILCCGSTDISELDLTNNHQLNRLECWGNHLTELDLSQNPALTQVLLGVQEVEGLKVKHVSEGYEVSLKDYVSHIENIDFNRVGANNYSVNVLAYDAASGSVIFEEYPKTLHYFYNTHSPNNDLLYVEVKSNLNIAVIERGNFSSYTHYLIGGMTASSYLDILGEPLTESRISSFPYSDYGKLGFTADGNSRLIIRVQTDKPGTVSFSLNDDIGAKLESLSRAELSSSTQLQTLDVGDSVYQVSAVLVAPESFPQSKISYFPSATFSVHVKFTDEDGQVSEDDIDLRIEAAPVILIHGLGDEGSACFGVGKGSGIWHSLRESGFRDIRIWNYDGTKGPNEVLAGTGSDNGLYTALNEVFAKYEQRGIVCTKADLVCHSMGGLMARKFLDESSKGTDNGNNWSPISYRQGMVRRVVTIATPHRGSPFAEFALEHELLAKKFFRNRDCTSAFIDLMTTAPRAYGFPANVPMYSIYGDISSELNNIARQLDVLSTGLDLFSHTAKFAPPLLIFFVDVLSFGSSTASDILTKINDEMFMGQGHDIVVGIPSARSDFIGYSSGYEGWEAMHTNICHQDNVGFEVAALLKSKVNMFKTFGASAKAANIPNTKMTANNVNANDFRFIEALTLNIEPSVFTVSDNGSQTVKFIAYASDVTSYDVYCAVEAGNDYRLFKLSDVGDNGKTFSAQLIFTSQDIGAMSVFCFSHNPQDSEGKSIHVSNTANLLALSDASSVNVTGLDLVGGSAIYVNAGSEIHAGLYAIADDGKYYDISSPLSGTEWTSTEIAEVTESGNIRGLKAGTTTLTASYKGFTASVSVDVRQNDAEQEAPTHKKPKILTKKLPSGRTGRLYTAQLESDTEGAEWTAENLPDGLTCSSSGLVSGVPSVSGKFKIAFTATANGLSKTKKVKIVIDEQVVITTQELPEGIMGKSYRVKIDYTGPKKTRVNIFAGAIPDGMKFSDKGKLSGKPDVFGTFEFSVRAANTEDESNFDEKTYRLVVTPEAPVIKTKKLKKGTVGKNYTSKLKAKSVAPVTWEVIGSLPSGLVLDTEAAAITGIPKEEFDGLVTLRASSTGGSDTKTYSMIVKPARKSRLSESAYTEDNVSSKYAVLEESKDRVPNDYADYSSARAEHDAISDKYIIIASLGRIEVDESGLYDFAAVLDENAPEGAELFCFMNSDAPSEDDEIAEFFDDSGQEIEAVPESRNITVSIWLNNGRVYAPVIAVKR